MAQVLLEGVVPDARDQLQGADEVRLARPVGADEHRDVGGQVQLDAADRPETLHNEASELSSHGAILAGGVLPAGRVIIPRGLETVDALGRGGPRGAERERTFPT